MRMTTRALLILTVAAMLPAAAVDAQQASTAPTTTSIVCAAKAGERQTCAADTRAGVTLVTVIGTAVCERGKTWDYDADSIWVSDGCSAVFAVAPAPSPTRTYSPISGFKLADTDQGDVNFKLFSYVRYLNQLGLDESYTDTFGVTRPVDRRQDVQLQKVNLQFLGWVGSRKLRYLAYVWTSNTSQGLGAQVVVGGNLQYVVNPHLTVGGGIGSLPTTRTLEGTFPYWLPVDNRLVADEFFRGSFTSGFWARGRVFENVDYQVMLGNNLSQLGVDAGQLDSGLNSLATSLAWLPTTGEFGRGFGDYEQHQQLATRVGVNFSRSNEDRQSQPGTEAIENSQIRTSDGNIVFTPGLFGPGIVVTDVKYQMVAANAGVKYQGFSLESEFYWRTLSDFTGPGTEMLPFRDMHDSGFKVEASAMPIPKLLQTYVAGSKIFGEYGDPWDLRVGVNYHPFRNDIIWWNGEYLQLRHSPVGGLSLPEPVGGNGSVFYSSFVVNF